MYELLKVSLPTKSLGTFTSKHQAAIELRSHICKNCLNGKNYYVGNDGKLFEKDLDLIVDTFYNGMKYECYDLDILLSTPCGLEYEIDEK